MEQNNFLKDSKNILIKIDCQGAEIPILKGSTKILNSVDFIIIEMPFFGKPTINLGKRQYGRVMPKSVINLEISKIFSSSVISCNFFKNFCIE